MYDTGSVSHNRFLVITGLVIRPVRLSARPLLPISMIVLCYNYNPPDRSISIIRRTHRRMLVRYSIYNHVVHLPKTTLARLHILERPYLFSWSLSKYKVTLQSRYAYNYKLCYSIDYNIVSLPALTTAHMCWCHDVWY